MKLQLFSILTRRPASIPISLVHTVDEYINSQARRYIAICGQANAEGRGFGGDGYVGFASAVVVGCAVFAEAGGGFADFDEAGEEAVVGHDEGAMRC